MVDAEDIWALVKFCLTGQSDKLLPKLLGLVIEQLAKDVNNTVDLLNENIERLVHVKYRAAIDFLIDAEIAWDDTIRRQLFLDDARKCFIEAIHLESAPFDAISMEYVAICHECSGDVLNAEAWLTKAYNQALINHELYSAPVKKCIQNFNKSVAYEIFQSMTLVGLLIPDPFKNITEDQYFEYLAIVFHSEAQISRLSDIIDVSHENSYERLFPEQVETISTSVRRGYKLSHFGVDCYDKQGEQICRFTYRMKR